MMISRIIGYQENSAKQTSAPNRKAWARRLRAAARRSDLPARLLPRWVLVVHPLCGQGVGHRVDSVFRGSGRAGRPVRVPQRGPAACRGVAALLVGQDGVDLRLGGAQQLGRVGVLASVMAADIAVSRTL